LCPNLPSGKSPKNDLRLSDLKRQNNHLLSDSRQDGCKNLFFLPLPFWLADILPSYNYVSVPLSLFFCFLSSFRINISLNFPGNKTKANQIILTVNPIAGQYAQS